jgi:hypothetical protein
MKWQCIGTHTIRQTQFSALIDSWVTSTPSIKMLCPQKNCLFLYFPKNITCLSVGLLSIGHVFSVSCKFCVSVNYDKWIFQLGYFRLHVAEVS